MGSKSWLFCTVALITWTIPAYAVPAKPLIVIFTPGVSTDALTNPQDPGSDAARLNSIARALRDSFEDSGIVDAVIYTPDSALFVRATLEEHIHPGNSALPTPQESYTLAKASGASYIGMIVADKNANQQANAVGVELSTEEVDSHKAWKSHRDFSGGATASGANDAIQSVANTLVNDFLAGPLHDLALSAPREKPPVEAIPVVSAPQPTSGGSEPADAVRATTNIMPSAHGSHTASKPESSGAETLKSTGTNTDGDADADSHQGENQLRSADIEAAILSFRKAVSLSPLNPKYRSQLAEAYLAANRPADALSEAKRALMVLPEDDRKGRLTAMRLLGEILTKNGDTTAARTTYENIISSQPNATWARIALADLLQTEGETDTAEAQYKQVLASTPADHDALLGYARLLATKGDYQNALNELTAASDANDQESRYRTAIALFDDGVNRIADLVEQNRVAWGAKRIAQDVFYSATSAQSAKVSGLVSFLKAVPPPPGSDERVKLRHNKRILAASLLLQGVASLLTQVETGDTDAGDQATNFLADFHHYINDVGTGSTAVPAQAPSS